MATADIKHWQTLSFRDADRMTEWLHAIGFTEHSTYRDDRDPSVVVHAEWVWAGGGVMFGSEREDSVGSSGPGTAACYLVVENPDSVFDAAVNAGASVVREMRDEDYGGRGGTVRDPEGNMWSFGDYQPG